MTEAKSREADDLPAECENASSPTPPEDIALLLEEIEALRDEIKALKEKDDSRGMVIRRLQETTFDLLDRDGGEPGAVTEARIGELLNALTKSGNGPISLARFSFRGEGRLSHDQVYRLASHLKRDPRFEIGRTDLRYVPRARRRAYFVWLRDRAPDWSRARF
jgi:ribosomal protein S15P/S13E